MEIFRKNLELNIHVDARQQFMSALKGIIDPEEKEKLLVESLSRFLKRVHKWTILGG